MLPPAHSTKVPRRRLKQWCAVRCAVQCSVALRCGVLCRAVVCYAVQPCAVPCSRVLCRAAVRCAVQPCAVPCSRVLCCAVACSDVELCACWRPTRLESVALVEVRLQAQQDDRNAVTPAVHCGGERGGVHAKRAAAPERGKEGGEGSEREGKRDTHTQREREREGGGGDVLASWCMREGERG